MDGSRKLAFALSAVLALLTVFDFTIGAPALRLNSDTGAVHAALAIWGLLAAASGARASNLFLVAAGLLLATDAFMGFTRGIFYLSFDAVRGAVEPLARPARYWGSALHAILGAVALVAGLAAANRQAKATSRNAPPA
jgi:hypothetical protein